MTAAESWDQTLRAHGYRITPQRQFVLESVTELGHGTPEEILLEVQKRAAGVNLSTVYRTLEVLEQVGLVTHAHLGHGAPTYHSVDEEVHVHLVCGACGGIDSIPVSACEPLFTQLEDERGFLTDATHVSFQGTCRPCREASAAARR